MDTIKSFKGYGKVDESEAKAFQHKTRQRLIIIIISFIVLAAIIIGAVVGTLVHKNNTKSNTTSPSSRTTPAQSIKAVCSLTRYPDSCFSSISSSSMYQNSNNNKFTDPEEIFKLTLQIAVTELSNLSSLPDKLIANSNDSGVKLALEDCKSLFDDAIDQLNSSIASMQVSPGEKLLSTEKINSNDSGVKLALEDCKSLFDDAIDQLNSSIASMQVSPGEKLLSTEKINDLKTWLSSAITDQETCLDGLQEMNSTFYGEFKTSMKNSTEFTSNSLAIVAKILNVLDKFDIPIHRKLLGFNSEFPEWVNSKDRRLLLQETNLKPDITVAKDGSGDFLTIKEAVGALSKKNKTRTVIYIKEGVYLGNVLIDKAYWNVMMYGDGKTKTILSGSLNNVDGTPTFSSATFAVTGRGFIARDIGFINTAGAAKHQAVAVRSGSDQSVFYRCSFDAFQDTLYAHSNRQFYRQCDIMGTIDFIFGNAAVVLQNCNIKPRQPLSNQFNTITAQGRKDPNQNSGISIQKCVITPLDDVKAPTYLGRPWKDFSVTVIMQTDISGIVDPEGWKSWIDNTDPPSTIFYAEYMNTGPGSGVQKRVKWDGYKPTITAEEAGKYTVNPFIQATEWLQQTNVMFDSSL